MKAMLSVAVLLGLTWSTTAQEPVPLPQVPPQEQVVPPQFNVPQPRPVPGSPFTTPAPGSPYIMPAPIPAPLPVQTIAATPVPAFKTKHQARKYQRDFERHLEKVFGQQFGSCVRCLDVDVDVFHCTICISGKAKNPLVGAQLQQFALSMPELAGYNVQLKVKS